jgi:cellulose synthase/poly-beta-1,6-N-acetylglucosamine synthase-like glycosyltransferase
MDALEASVSVARSPGTEPLVSVLVPSYNQEKYVIDCLESIRNLDYPNLELILSDDASSDATFEVAGRWIEEHRERFVRAVAVRQPVNLGIVRHFQYLFDQAQGEFLAYLASDDCLVPASIRCRLGIFQQDGSIDAVFGNAEQIQEDGNLLKPQFIPPYLAAQLSDRRLLLLSLILNWRVPGPVMMLRREATLQGGSLGRLPEDLHGEDAYIYIRLAALGKLRFINEIVAKWRIVPGSSSNPVERNHFTRSYTLESDRRLRPMLRGLDRLALNLRIGDSEAVLNPGSRLPTLCKRVFLRLIVIQFRLLLRLRTLGRREA